MSGETSDADRSRRDERRRKRLEPDNTSADKKYYASGDRSALSGQSPSDSTGRPGKKSEGAGQTPAQKPAPARKPARSSDLPGSADKKYYAGSPAAPTKQQIEKQKAGLGRPAQMRGRNDRRSNVDNAGGYVELNGREAHDVYVENVSGIDDAVDRILLLANGSQDGSQVKVTCATRDVSRRLQSRLDAIVGQGLLTEDRRRDVTCVAAEQTRPDQPQPPEPKPEETVRVDDDAFLDPDAIMSGEHEDEAVDTTPDGHAPEVDADTGEELPRPEEAPAPAGEHDDDDGDGFMSPGHPPATFGKHADAPPTEADAAPKGDKPPEDHPATLPENEAVPSDHNPATLPRNEEANGDHSRGEGMTQVIDPDALRPEENANGGNAEGSPGPTPEENEANADNNNSGGGNHNRNKKKKHR